MTWFCCIHPPTHRWHAFDYPECFVELLSHHLIGLVSDVIGLVVSFLIILWTNSAIRTILDIWRCFFSLSCVCYAIHSIPEASGMFLTSNTKDHFQEVSNQQVTSSCCARPAVHYLYKIGSCHVNASDTSEMRTLKLWRNKINSLISFYECLYYILLSYLRESHRGVPTSDEHHIYVVSGVLWVMCNEEYVIAHFVFCRDSGSMPPPKSRYWTRWWRPWSSE